MKKVMQFFDANFLPIILIIGLFCWTFFIAQIVKNLSSNP
jgi:hypothetical protein